MRASEETYENVARKCSAFEPYSKEGYAKNSVNGSENKVSCTNCIHFDSEKYCRLDLYDKIVQNHNCCDK